MKENKETIVIGESYDGFRLTFGDCSVWVSQEESPAEYLKTFFKKLGYKVEIEQEY